MILKNKEYAITRINDEDAIAITKKALEEWRDHYLKMADGLKKEPWGWGFYVGRAETLIDLLKHFEEEIV